MYVCACICTYTNTSLLTHSNVSYLHMHGAHACVRALYWVFCFTKSSGSQPVKPKQDKTITHRFKEHIQAIHTTIESTIADRLINSKYTVTNITKHMNVSNIAQKITN
jgi:hypothetical protein